jgi:16S rRNA (cytosine967-C5)-methyltransferase
MREGNKGVRQLATEILAKVDARKAYADILLDRSLKSTELSDRDRALLTELVYGTLRWRGHIDGRVSSNLRRPLTDTDAFLRNLLRMTLYQLLFLDRVPAYAAVNEAVQTAKVHGGDRAAGFINGVLRNFLREKRKHAAPGPGADTIGSLAVEYSHPRWLVKRWLDELGREETTALMKANNERARLVLRVNLRRSTRDGLLDLLEKNGIAAGPTRWSPQGLVLEQGAAVDRLPGFREGLFQVQGEASQLVAYLLSPRPGERILDACAAPGGKTTHLAEFMEDTGRLIALDRSDRGLEKIRANSARLGLTSIHAAKSDVSREAAAGLRGPYNRVLVDAPCSGLGTLRSHPEIKWHRAENDIERLSALQLKILHQVASYLGPGGILVYSTCTLTSTENEQVVENFLEQHKQFELENAAAYLPEAALSLVRGKYFLALPHRHDTDGFFAARMRKVAP